MKERIHNIMNSIKIDPFYCAGFNLTQDNYPKIVYEVQTLFSKEGHRTWIEFNVATDVLRVVSTHLFGYLDTNTDISASDLVEVLKANRGHGFEGAASYIAVSEDRGTLFVSLQAYNRFLLKWDDTDIADMIALQLMDYMSAFVSGPWPKPIVVF